MVYQMHYVTGDAMGNLGKVCKLDCPKYPGTEIRLNTDLGQFAQNMGSHHCAIVYADLSKQIKTLCELPGIDVLVG